MSTADRRPTVSVVIATYRRERLLCDTIRDVLAQDHESFEVLVIDQSPAHEPETTEFLAAQASRIRYFRLSVPSLPAARNFGLRESYGGLVVFLDDDVEIPHKDFLRAHVSALSRPNVRAVGGRITIPGVPDRPCLDPRHEDPLLGWMYTNFSYTERVEVATVYGANMSFHRDTLLEVGGFDENYSNPAYNEDVDVSIRLRARGYTIMFEPRARLVHHTYGAGGCDNRYIHGKTREAQVYYRGYWRNYVYFLIKNIPVRPALQVLWYLYRSHVMNWPYLKVGLRYVLHRHWVIACATWEAVILYRRFTQRRTSQATIGGTGAYGQAAGL